MRVVSIWIIPSTTWRYRQVVEGYILFSSPEIPWIELRTWTSTVKENCVRCIEPIFRPQPQLVKLTLCSGDASSSCFLPGYPSEAREAWQAKMGACLPPPGIWPLHKSCLADNWLLSNSQSQVPNLKSSSSSFCHLKH